MLRTFLSSGQTSAYGLSSVVTVIPNGNNSSSSLGGNLVGSISQDRSTASPGSLGEASMSRSQTSYEPHQAET